MKYKKLIQIACVIIPLAASANARPGYIDLESLLGQTAVQPEVNVNLPSFLLKEVAEGYTSDPDNPLAEAGIDLDRLIKDVRSIRLTVYEGTAAADASLQTAVKSLSQKLDAEWVSLVRVPGENVGIYVTSDPQTDTMAGLALLIAQKNTVVIGNIEGRVPIAMILQLAAKSNALPKDLLQSILSSGQTGPAEAPQSPTPPDAPEPPAAPEN